tara:strand:+ start:3170 stop:3715 length:546 start_codon:yes stop_codon:yes gene_type:complete
MITDADIFWPPALKMYIPGLEINTLYGFYRRVIRKVDIGLSGQNEWHETLDDIESIYLGGDYRYFATMKDLNEMVPIDTRANLQLMGPYFDIEPPEVFSAMGWNSNVASTLDNPLPLGYGQLFNCQLHKNRNYPEDFTTAAGCDSYFSSLWSEAFRQFVPRITALHLGPRMVHWDGRKILE